MKRSIVWCISGLGALSLAFGCASKPGKAPGSNPEDMTEQGHRDAAAQEHEKAAEHEKMKEDVPTSKYTVEQREKSEHEKEAEKHENYAGQHEKAADTVADGGAKKKTTK